MKNKIKIGLVLTGVLAATVVGGTMAWFTNDTVLASSEFKTGTVVINANKPTEVAMEDRYIDNVNPGDCATVIWEIVNTGTKSADLRVKLEDKWLDESLSSDNVHYAPAPGSGWATYTSNEETWFYYTDGPVAGTYKDQEASIVKLPIVIAFDGAATGNEYQNKKYRISGKAEAIQGTNGAAEAVWGYAWTDVKNGIDQINQYFVTGPGKDMPCWKKNETVNPEEPGQGADHEVKVMVAKVGCNHKDRGTVEGGGKYSEGEKVTIKAIANPHYKFQKWTIDDVKVDGAGATYEFDMGAEDVTYTAHFEFSIF